MTQSYIAVLIIFLVPGLLCRHIERISRRHGAGEESSHSGPARKTHLRLHAKPPPFLHATEGRSEYLECQAGGKPSPVIHWLKDGKILSQDDLESFKPVSSLISSDKEVDSKLNIGSVVSRIYLDCISPEDEAEYTCVAENPYHRSSATTQVRVALSDERNCEDKNTYGHAPRIYSWTKTMLETQGQETKLLCQADGFPKPKIQWLQTVGTRQEELKNGHKYQILHDGSLLIRNLKWTDMGNYICSADNIHGTAKAEVFLYPAIPES